MSNKINKLIASGIVFVLVISVNANNLVKNGKFNESLKKGWKVYCSKPSSIKIQSDPGGEKCVTFSLKQSKGIQLSSKVMPYDSKQKYVLKFWHKGATLKLAIQFFAKSANDKIRVKPFQKVLKITAHQDWTEVSLKLPAEFSLDAKKCRISFSMNKTISDASISLVNFSAIK